MNDYRQNDTECKTDFGSRVSLKISIACHFFTFVSFLLYVCNEIKVVNCIETVQKIHSFLFVAIRTRI